MNTKFMPTLQSILSDSKTIDALEIGIKSALDELRLQEQMSLKK